VALKSAHRWILPLSALVSVGLFSTVPAQGFHPFALLASLLPLQLAALFWCLGVVSKGAESRLVGQRLPAND
jgi:hypothetical protein